MSSQLREAHQPALLHVGLAQHARDVGDHAAADSGTVGERDRAHAEPAANVDVLAGLRALEAPGAGPGARVDDALVGAENGGGLRTRAPGREIGG
jgi:hypothetical protein